MTAGPDFHEWAMNDAAQAHGALTAVPERFWLCGNPEMAWWRQTCVKSLAFSECWWAVAARTSRKAARLAEKHEAQRRQLGLRVQRLARCR